MEFRHPNYYKELRKRNKLDQAISKEPATAGNQRSPGPGPKASSSKQQAIEETVPHNDIEEAASVKHQAVQDSWCKLQAPSSKPQAPSRKQQAPGYFFPDKVLQRQESGSLLR